MRHLIERAATADDGVQDGQQQSYDERDADDPLHPSPAPNDRFRISKKAVSGINV